MFWGDMPAGEGQWVPHGESLSIRCSHIGRFQLLGPRVRLCQNGLWTRADPVCLGLSQEHQYSRKQATMASPAHLSRSGQGPHHPLPQPAGTHRPVDRRQTTRLPRHHPPPPVSLDSQTRHSGVVVEPPGQVLPPM